MTIGVIGLGNVGSGLAKSLLRDGHDVVGYDIDETARNDAAELGVRVAADNEVLAAEADVVLLSLPHPDASRAAVEAVVGGADPGTDVFDTSTISPLTARELHRAAAEVGVHYFDSPITGGAVGAHAGELTALVGGDPDRIRDRRDVLSSVAAEVYHVGAVGDAQFVKLVHNHVGQTVLVILVEGLLLAEEFGVDPAVLYRTLRHYTGIYDDKLDAFFSNEFPEAFEDHFALGEVAVAGNRFELEAAHKDLVELESLADAHDSYLPLGSFVQQFHREGVNAGYGDRPHPDLLQLYEDLFETTVETTEAGRSKSAGRIL